MPEFIGGEAVADGRLEKILEDWQGLPANLYLLTPPNGPRPARVQVLVDFLIQRLSRPSGSAVNNPSGGARV
jgi:DNA-binding transcriptional LysR family regulator